MGAGSKAPMDFLNKKGWHPGSYQNQQKKWKLEQEALAEQKRVEELRKEHARDRERQELDALAAAAGLKPSVEKLEWMYQPGMKAGVDAERELDEERSGCIRLEGLLRLMRAMRWMRCPLGSLPVFDAAAAA